MNGDSFPSRGREGLRSFFLGKMHVPNHLVECLIIGSCKVCTVLIMASLQTNLCSLKVVKLLWILLEKEMAQTQDRRLRQCDNKVTNQALTSLTCSCPNTLLCWRPPQPWAGLTCCSSCRHAHPLMICPPPTLFCTSLTCWPCLLWVARL